MIGFARDAVRLSRRITRHQLEEEIVPRRALERLIELVGEAAKRVSAEAHRREPAILWSKIMGMRDWLAHDYHDIDLNVLWDTARNGLPPLIKQLEQALKSPGPRR